MAVLMRGAVKLGIVLWCAAVGGFCHGARVAAGDDSGGHALSEYRLKAVFLYNFTQFVEWPSDAFAGPEQPFEICVLGHDPFGAELDEVVQGESVGGRSLSVQRLRTVAELTAHGDGSCQILYLGAPVDDGNQKAVAQWVTTPPRRAVLTVADVRGKGTPGVMIAFDKQQQRIRLRVDGELARAAGLTVSSKLLRIGS